jgi:hypothetical protein
MVLVEELKDIEMTFDLGIPPFTRARHRAAPPRGWRMTWLNEQNDDTTVPA